ncbi:PREDICTED: non-classical arabinogalactan protein 31-like [Lupinus angustifolius]|uniref:non-classical arabinogalactan protein 31-like n=1 Tax=Lupinus angustifolius TaxID=3871 RepID=UPI00092FC915|nr:PREDICTED: non-classical arabinogalactan protein 31-like [Lupinus angustifolius]
MGYYALTLIMIASSVLVGCTNNLVLALDESRIIHVGGKVLCQDCSHGWNEWVYGGKPIKGAKVSLTCMDKRERVVYYTSDKTDELGQYDISVNNYVYGKELNTKGCLVRLVSSPDYVCNILTDFGGGKSGVKLNQPTLVYRSLIKYVINPFYYTTPLCDKPDTNASNSESKDPHGEEGHY